MGMGLVKCILTGDFHIRVMDRGIGVFYYPPQSTDVDLVLEFPECVAAEIEACVQYMIIRDTLLHINIEVSCWLLTD